MNKLSHDIRNGLLCAFAVAAAMWASYPVAETGFIDDWSYIKVAELFAHTGHIAYNGWGEPMLGWQVVWGGLFIKLFGFSFTVARLSMLPVAMATIFLLYIILRRFGVTPRNATFGTLTFGLSPLFLPLAASFMTDMPSVFVVLLCLYLCKRALDAETARSAILWLSVAAASNIVGGTVRQIAWLGVLTMVPSTGWLLRKRRGVLSAALVLWGIGAVTILLAMRWFAHQPHTVAIHVLYSIGKHPVVHSVHALLQLAGLGLCLALMVYPILVAWLPKIRLLRSPTLLGIAVAVMVWGCIEWISNWTMPWLFSVISSEFATTRTVQAAPTMLVGRPTWVREMISLGVITTVLVFLEQLKSELWPQIKSHIQKRTLPSGPWWQILWLLGPFTLGYILPVMPRAYHMAIYDRYLLPLMPLAILCTTKLYQQWRGKSVPAISVIFLAIFALLGIAGTHDWFAWNRARLAAANEIRATGIPRTKIQGGLAYDGWTQIETVGIVPSSWVDLSGNPIQAVPEPCRLGTAFFMPAVKPRFTLVFPKKMWCLAASNFAPVTYRKWLPPFQGAVYIQKIACTSH